MMHQEYLCVKSIKMTNVVMRYQSLFNYTRSKGMNKYKDFLSEMECKYGYVLCYRGIHWLICGRMLIHVYDLKSETELFQILKESFHLSIIIMNGYVIMHSVLISRNT
jgi:hypothetical protein